MAFVPRWKVALGKAIEKDGKAAGEMNIPSHLFFPILM